MPISLVLDIIISVLLVLTIAYAMRLNQRLSQLRSDKNELLQLAKTFAEATVRAEAGIQNLKISSDALRAEVDKASTLKDDLSYLVERGGRSADEMVANVRAPMRAANASHGVGMGAGAGARGDTDMGASRRTGPDARLIEDAIRAASAQATEPNPRADAGRAKDMTRRIAGHPANAGGGARTPSHGPSHSPSGRTSGALATRGLGRDLDRMAEDDEAIEDTQAARELLKALSAVK